MLSSTSLRLRTDLSRAALRKSMVMWESLGDGGIRSFDSKAEAILPRWWPLDGVEQLGDLGKGSPAFSGDDLCRPFCPGDFKLVVVRAADTGKTPGGWCATSVLGTSTVRVNALTKPYLRTPTALSTCPMTGSFCFLRQHAAGCRKVRAARLRGAADWRVSLHALRREALTTWLCSANSCVRL